AFGRVARQPSLIVEKIGGPLIFTAADVKHDLKPEAQIRSTSVAHAERGSVETLGVAGDIAGAFHLANDVSKRCLVAKADRDQRRGAMGNSRPNHDRGLIGETPQQ